MDPAGDAGAQAGVDARRVVAGPSDAPLPAGTVTLLFTDIEGSTTLLERLGDAYAAVLDDHHAIVRAAIAAHGGREVDSAGDSFFAAFPTASAAVACAAQAQRALAAHAWPPGVELRVRMGVHTGAPQVHGARYVGVDVHRAARIMAAAHGGQVLLSAATRALVDVDVAALGEHALKDFPGPQALFQLVVDGVGPDAFPAPRTLERRRTNLPPAAGDLLGREQELDELVRRSSGERLLTIAGGGGSGKTSLALELGRRLLDRFADGVFFVALDQVSDPAAVPTAIAHTLGLPETPGVTPFDRVAAHLRGRELLLLLDNFEHLLDAAPVASRLAAAGDGVRVVVTTQAPLRVAGEHVVALGPLAVPAGDVEELDALARVPAVALLLERARAAAPAFALTAGNAAAVREMCARLDGVPLALELAASRLALLTPDALLERLDGSLEALGRGARDLPARQRGLRAMLEWTCGVLEQRERLTLARLSVFAGGFTLELAEAAFGDALDEIGTLLDVGLLRRDGGSRLSMGPPVRRYAGELLDVAGEEEAARRAHAEALVRMAEPWEERWPLRGGAGAPVLHAEAANVLEALSWARHADVVLHARLAAATGWWLNYSSRHREGLEHVDAALAAVDDPRLRARLREARGTLSLTAADPADSLRAAREWQALGDLGRVATSLFYAANLHAHAGRVREVLALGEETLSTARATGEDELIQLGELAVAQGLRVGGEVERSLGILTKLIEQVRAKSLMAFFVATLLADTELQAQRPAEALAHYGIAMRELEPLSSPMGELIQADTIAVALGRLGRAQDAATALGVSELGHREISTPPTVEFAEMLAEVRDGLDDETLAAGRARARGMGMRAGLSWVGAIARGELD